MQARNYVFTLFGSDSEPEGPAPLCPEDFPKWLSYMVYQREVCPDTGRVHFQGYIELAGKHSMVQLHGVAGLEHAHFEVRRGTQGQARDYAMKADTRVEGPWEYGELKAQGKRSDLEDIKVLVDCNTPILQIWEQHYGSMIRYHRSVKEYKRIKTAKRNWVTNIIIIIGPSGIGKSRLAREMAADAYWKPPGKWWDDYDGHSTVIWDEFSGQYPFRELLRILDSSPLSVESKGSYVQFVADTVIFTSNFGPADWYNEDAVGHPWVSSPLHRRILEFGHIIDLSPRKPPPRLVLVGGDLATMHLAWE